MEACFLIDLMFISLNVKAFVGASFSYRDCDIVWYVCFHISINSEDQTYQEKLLLCVVFVVTRTVTYVDTDHMLGWGRGGAGQQPLTGRPPLCGKLGLSVLSSQLNLSSHPCLVSPVNGSNFEITASKLGHASIKSCGGKVSLCRIPTTRSFFFTIIF